MDTLPQNAIGAKVVSLPRPASAIVNSDIRSSAVVRTAPSLRIFFHWLIVGGGESSFAAVSPLPLDACQLNRTDDGVIETKQNRTLKDDSFNLGAGIMAGDVHSLFNYGRVRTPTTMILVSTTPPFEGHDRALVALQIAIRSDRRLLTLSPLLCCVAMCRLSASSSNRPRSVPTANGCDRPILFPPLLRCLSASTG